jgi:hypothetical protein
MLWIKVLFPRTHHLECLPTKHPRGATRGAHSELHKRKKAVLLFTKEMQLSTTAPSAVWETTFLDRVNLLPWLTASDGRLLTHCMYTVAAGHAYLTKGCSAHSYSKESFLLETAARSSRAPPVAAAAHQQSSAPRCLSSKAPQGPGSLRTGPARD